MRSIVLAALCAAALATGCSATPRAGDRLTLEGELVLKGSEPNTVPVLRGAGQQWELQDVAPATARVLQNQRVQASGVVTRAPAAGPELPALRVQRLEPLR